MNDIINYNNKQYKFIINKTFKTTTDITERTIMIADAFGLGVDDEQEFNLYENFTFGFNLGDIVYITGDSGSGKTVLLNEIKVKLDREDYVDYDELIIDDNEVLINSVGKNLNDAVRILSLVGLNDAFLFLRKYKQLSDGQKRRYKIAKLINLDKKVWFFDEFLATLDRETAKIIAFNLQKNVRKLNKTLIIATTHIDLKEDLQPNIYIYKKFNDDIITEYNDEIDKEKRCSIIKDLKVEIGDKNDYNVLKKFHYKNEGIGAVKNIYSLTLNNSTIGVIVITYPLLSLRGRNTAIPGYSEASSENAKKINEDFECIGRIVIHPKYRSIGLAYNSIKEYMKLTTCKYIETIAVMANYNPFFEKAGMIKVDYDKDYDKTYLKILNNFREIGFEIDLMHSVKYITNIYNNLNKEQKLSFLADCERLIKGYNSTHGGDYVIKEINGEIQEFDFIKKIIRGNIVYLYKENENYKEIIKKNLFQF
jgi:ABC-type lipoprotein export system ATPase subunit